jgi:hypothetical protein
MDLGFLLLDRRTLVKLETSLDEAIRVTMHAIPEGPGPQVLSNLGELLSYGSWLANFTHRSEEVVRLVIQGASHVAAGNMYRTIYWINLTYRLHNLYFTIDAISHLGGAIIIARQIQSESLF